VQGALASRTSRGGTAPSALAEQLNEAKSSLEKTRSEFTVAAKDFSTMLGA
jgi:argininosuccinate lyase